MTSTLSDPPPPVELETRRALDGATDVVLRDGSTVHVRPTVPADVEAVAAFLDGLSPDARWFRFLGGGINAQRAARGLVDRGVGLVATAGVDGHVVAHACFVPEPTASGPSWPSPWPTRGRGAGSGRSCSRTWRSSPRRPGSRR